MAELDDILNAVDKSDNPDTENKDNKDNSQNSEAILYAFLMALQGITIVISDHTKLKSIALTDGDVNTLQSALKPFVSYIMQLVDIIIYLPLITFAIGYTLRIVDELKTKRKEKNKELTEVKG